MKKRSQKQFAAAASLLAAFVLWTEAIRRIDVRPIGPLGSCVGFSALNHLVHNLTGVHMGLYTITDWLGLVPILFALGFAVLGLIQWIKGRSIRQVDGNLLVLGAFYAAVMAAYAIFEKHVINYRPVLIEGVLEASYPSSTTLLVLCVMPTAAMQWNRRIPNRILRSIATGAITAFVVFMVIGRLFSGVHWFTDIVGGILLSAGLVMLYRAVSNLR